MNKLRITLGGLLTTVVVVLAITASSNAFLDTTADASTEIVSSKKVLDSYVRDESLVDDLRDLSLTQIFEQSESGIVSIAVTKSSFIELNGGGYLLMLPHDTIVQQGRTTPYCCNMTL